MTRIVLAFLCLSLSACLEGIEVRRDGKPVAFLTESCEQSDGVSRSSPFPGARIHALNPGTWAHNSVG